MSKITIPCECGENVELENQNTPTDYTWLSGNCRCGRVFDLKIYDEEKVD